MNIYQENGYNDRMDYLISLSKEYEVPLDVVMTLADVYGSTEDFDGLIVALEDYADLAM